ncbi:helix-turn-helix transcriptional regulator [Antarcticirhabdus aurantiaca]|uniref:Helix-turn-helix transcriptional regulator n=1 Tax=Antarcticirhabdus aurantiaca TaxID=2606717 RepID=A0ACD4NPV5_9HYPH|nr:helix-turn-helix transcriptional regulator [Antarcticirhabdus aurantiaca]WAJ28941.1 helix-turn-helix transcriptional regulator [Jeongeuplla avenae]
MEEAAFLALVERCYDTAFDAAGWADLLQDMAIAFDCVGGNIVQLGAGEPLVAYSPSIAHAASAYATEWVGRDPWFAYMQRHRLGAGFYVDTDYIAPEVRARDPFYQDFRRSLGMSSTLSLILHPYEGMQLGLGASRLRHSEFVSQQERERFAALGRHLGRAATLSFRLNAAETLNQSLLDQLGRFDCAVAIVSKGGKLLRSNSLLHSLEADGLAIRRGRLALGQPALQARLERYISQALLSPTQAPPVEVLALPRPGSALPLLLRAVFLGAQVADRRLGASEPAVVLLVLRPDMPGYPPLDQVLVALGLTRGQARFALAVGAGHSLKEAAELFKVSDETARSMLKQVYARLGINRQSQLARLIARVAPFEA